MRPRVSKRRARPAWLPSAFRIRIVGKKTMSSYGRSTSCLKTGLKVLCQISRMLEEIMKRFALLFCCFIAQCAAVEAIDLSGLESIGTISSYRSTSNGILFNCSDGSQVQIWMLAPDLARVRASFRKPLPQRDHSWAIARTEWGNPKWKVTEAPDALVLTPAHVQI